MALLELRRSFLNQISKSRQRSEEKYMGFSSPFTVDIGVYRYLPIDIFMSVRKHTNILLAFFASSSYEIIASISNSLNWIDAMQWILNFAVQLFFSRSSLRRLPLHQFVWMACGRMPLHCMLMSLNHMHTIIIFRFRQGSIKWRKKNHVENCTYFSYESLAPTHVCCRRLSFMPFVIMRLMQRLSFLFSRIN